MKSNPTDVEWRSTGDGKIRQEASTPSPVGQLQGRWQWLNHGTPPQNCPLEGKGDGTNSRACAMVFEESAKLQVALVNLRACSPKGASGHDWK